MRITKRVRVPRRIHFFEKFSPTFARVAEQEGEKGKEEEEEKDKIKRIALSVYNLQAKRLIMKLIKPIRFSRFLSTLFSGDEPTMMKQLLPDRNESTG